CRPRMPRNTAGTPTSSHPSPADPRKDGPRRVFVAPPGDWVRGRMPQRWLEQQGVEAILTPHPSPQFRVPDAMARFETLAAGPPAVWHFYPFPHDTFLVDTLRVRGHT